MTEDERQALIKAHIDITPHEDEMEWNVTSKGLFRTVSESPDWWAYAAALQQLEREWYAGLRTQAAKRATAQLKLVKRAR
jgi:hypothetical protein